MTIFLITINTLAILDIIKQKHFACPKTIFYFLSMKQQACMAFCKQEKSINRAVFVFERSN